MKKNKSEMMVTQSNLLIESRFNFSLSETKMLLWMIKEVQPGDKDFKDYRIYIKDFISARKAKNKNKNLYTMADEMTDVFMTRLLKVPLADGGMDKFTLMSFCSYKKGDGYLEYRFDKALKPHLIALKKQFTTYDVRNILNCHHSHSVRIYQLLKSFEGLKERTITVKDLRYMLMLENEYQRFHDFKRFILERSRKDLKKYSDLFFEYSLNKRGRNIHSITFTIKKQRQRRLFDGKPEPSLADAQPLTSYQKPADATLKRLEEEEKDSIPIPEDLKSKFEA
jgi:plasmid replication initiation protein